MQKETTTYCYECRVNVASVRCLDATDCAVYCSESCARIGWNEQGPSCWVNKRTFIQCLRNKTLTPRQIVGNVGRVLEWTRGDTYVIAALWTFYDMRDPFNTKLQQACTWGDAYAARTLLRDDRVDPRGLNLLSLATRNGHMETIATLLNDERVRNEINARDLRDDSPSQAFYTFWNTYAQRQGKRRTYADEESVYKRSNAPIGPPMGVFVKDKQRFQLLITKLTLSEKDFLSTLDQLTPFEIEDAINWMLLPEMSDVVKNKMNETSVLSAFERMAVTARIFDLWNVHAIVSNVHFLKRAALIRPQDKQGYAVFWAVQNDYLDVLHDLLKDGRADPEQYYGLPFLVAVSANNVGMVEALLRDGRVDPGKSDNLALIRASEWNYVSIVKLLLESTRVDPSAMDYESVNVATRQGNATVLRYLLADPRVHITRKRAIDTRDAQAFGSPVWKVWNNYIEREDRRANPTESVLKRTRRLETKIKI